VTTGTTGHGDPADVAGTSAVVDGSGVVMASATTETVDLTEIDGFVETARAVTLPAEAYRGYLTEAFAVGWRFAGLYAVPGAGVVRVLLTAADGATRLVAVRVRGGHVPTIVDLAPAADWDEREAHDLHQVDFLGHTPLRPLVHRGDLREWTVPVRGRDVHQVAVGPIHAGVIESGHFRFHLVGESILHLDAQLFHKHRGLERAAEGLPLVEGIAHVTRACGACAASNGVAYAHAVEQALGLVPSPDLARARTLLLELERLWSHLNDVAAICAGVGMAPGVARFTGFTEQARRLNADLTGHRFLFGSVQVGGSNLVLDAETARAVRRRLTELRTEIVGAWRELSFNLSLQDRLPGVGVLDAATARDLGVVGPAARAAGLAEDVRAASPRLSYPAFTPVVPARATGDARARFEQRALELWQTLDLLDGLLDRPVVTATAEPGTDPRPIGIGRVESPRGATSCVVERDGDRIGRVRLRTGSYANWPAVAAAAAGNILPDFPLINKSFELCYACADR
jgi:Ni,Fe-hydrogenase III large subunit